MQNIEHVVDVNEMVAKDNCRLCWGKGHVRRILPDKYTVDEKGKRDYKYQEVPCGCLRLKKVKG